MSSTRSEINIVVSQNFERSSTTEIIRGTNSSTFSFMGSKSIHESTIGGEFSVEGFQKGTKRKREHRRASLYFVSVHVITRFIIRPSVSAEFSYEISRIGFLAPLDASTALKGARSLNCLLKSVIELISSLGN